MWRFIMILLSVFAWACLLSTFVLWAVVLGDPKAILVPGLVNHLMYSTVASLVAIAYLIWSHEYKSSSKEDEDETTIN